MVWDRLYQFNETFLPEKQMLASEEVGDDGRSRDLASSVLAHPRRDADARINSGAGSGPTDGKSMQCRSTRRLRGDWRRLRLPSVIGQPFRYPVSLR